MLHTRSATVSGMLIAASLLIAACNGLQLNINFTIPHRSQAVDTQTIDMPADASLLVTNDVGSTRVTVDPAASQATVEITRIALADTQAAADALLGEIVVSVTPPSDNDNRLVIASSKPADASDDTGQFQIQTTDDETTIVSITNSIKVAQVQLRITLPAGHACDVTQSAGSIRAVALDTPGTLKTFTGSIHTTGCQTALSASTSTGSVTVDSHEGSLDIGTDTGAADLEVLDLRPDESVVVRLTNGSIALTLPRKVDADLKALTETGSIDFHRHSFFDTFDVIQSRTSLSATLNDGGANVDLRTETGSIDIAGN